MSNQNSTLVFSIGPVQGFIAQSRRTADGWVGSFILSYLACKAAIKLKDDGDVIEPYLENIPLYKELKGIPDPGDLTIAGLPNNIVVKLKDGADPMTIGGKVEKVVEEEWRKIAEAIWKALYP